MMAITLDGTNGITHTSGTNQKVSLASGTSVASTSGTSVDFILSADVAPYVKRVTVMFSGVSTNGTSNAQIQLGSGSYTTSGYLGTSQASTAAGNSAATSTTGFVLLSGSASYVFSGLATFTNITGNTWVGSISAGQSDSARSIFTNASISLSGALDRIRITTVNGTDTFDAGSINILYE